ncbi:V-type ATP synthase subunit F [Pyrodictium abyssi]|uniref:V-type ATP synthase subunit F n=1 Tax=Pyrodictium abyssi TaxID=54256 RepID=A0ABM8IVS4_9CREN|nr:V-type ATP synthase subunit F [Pyrodictium abyssi]
MDRTSSGEGYRVVVIGDEETVSLFRLIGYLGHVASASELLDVMIRYISREDVGLIVVTYDLVEENTDKYFELKARLRKPLLIEIPSIRSPWKTGIDYLELFRRAVAGSGAESP